MNVASDSVLSFLEIVFFNLWPVFEPMSKTGNSKCNPTKTVFPIEVRKKKRGVLFLLFSPHLLSLSGSREN